MNPNKNLNKNDNFCKNYNFNFDKLYRALDRIKKYENFEFSDQKFLIENLIKLIADNILTFDSLIFKRICSKVRILLDKEKIKFI